ncbi:MAG: type IA DNA topoisomerase [Marinagarivorans sp.]|nr:type IA DNA topoisomerase [Marinagarivorans sp.]
MASILIVVESPNKAKSIRKYFPDFTVVATVGHFRDLPVDRMGAEPPHHKPEYVTMEGKADVEKKLRAAAKTADIIYLASDPDREGEAISAHVANCIGQKFNSKMHRITYKEVNKKAIEQAIIKKRSIDWALVRAQEARRVIDRYVGYMVSPALTDVLKSVNKGIPYLSAGRVQSVALKLVVERDRAIKAFKSVNHYGVSMTCEHAGIEFKAEWLPSTSASVAIDAVGVNPDDDTGDVEYSNLITDRAIPEAVIARTTNVTVASVTTKRVSIAPPLPLITSSFVKLMAGRFRLSTKASMDAAQKLFENGLITYHRTDSPIMGEEFADEVRFFAESQGLLVPRIKRVVSAKAGSQEGHECLRVTDIRQSRVDLSDAVLEEVYHLVWLVTLQSQLANAEEDRTQIILTNEAGDKYLAKGRVEVVEGWKCSWRMTINSENENKDIEEKSGAEKKLPAIAEGNEPVIKNIKLDEKKTQAPAPYSEKTLVAKLDKLKIGRPSTYAQTIERIVQQQYVSRDKKLTLQSLALGDIIVSVLDGRYEFMNYEYTAELEELIDDISNEKMDYKDLVDAVYISLLDNNEFVKTKPLSEALTGEIKKLSFATATEKPKTQRKKQ